MIPDIEHEPRNQRHDASKASAGGGQSVGVQVSQENSVRVIPPASWAHPEHHLEQLLEHPWYRHLIILVDEISVATHKFFNARGFRAALFPLTTPSISSPMGLSSDSLPVRIRLRDEEIFLADSMQFSLELACRVHKRGAYYLMPTFRGEDVDARHLSQFFHAEAEILGTLEDVMTLAEDYVIFLTRHVFETCPDSISSVAGTTAHVERILSEGFKFHRMRFNEVEALLGNVSKAIEYLGAGVARLTEQGERELIRRYGDFIWITHMPWAAIPFYQGRESNSTYGLNADLLGGIGEMLGCGERALSADDTRNNMIAQNVDPADYHWYIRMKKQVELQTAGFGLGIERYLLWVTKHNDIRDCALLVRDHGKPHQP